MKDDTVKTVSLGVVAIGIGGLAYWLLTREAEAGEANFQLSNLIISPNPVHYRSVVTVEVTVTNIGDDYGQYQLTWIKPEPLDPVVVSTGILGPNESRVMSIGWPAGEVEGIGTHTVSVDGLTATYTVLEDLPAPAVEATISWD